MKLYSLLAVHEDGDHQLQASVLGVYASRDAAEECAPTLAGSLSTDLPDHWLDYPSKFCNFETVVAVFYTPLPHEDVWHVIAEHHLDGVAE